MGRAARQPSQVLLEGVLRAPHQGQQVEGRDAGHVASADLQHANQTLHHGGPQAFHLRERARRAEAAPVWRPCPRLTAATQAPCGQLGAETRGRLSTPLPIAAMPCPRTPGPAAATHLSSLSPSQGHQRTEGSATGLARLGSLVVPPSQRPETRVLRDPGHSHASSPGHRRRAGATPEPPAL